MSEHQPTLEDASCASIAAEVANSQTTEATAAALGLGVTWASLLGDRTMLGALDAAGRGELVHEAWPGFVEGVVHAACLPAELGEQAGHAIGTHVNALWGEPGSTATPSHDASPPSAFSHDAFGSSHDAGHSSHDTGHTSHDAGHDAGSSHE